MAERQFYELVVHVPGFDYVARIFTSLFAELPVNPDKYNIGQALLAWGALTPDSRLSDVEIFQEGDAFLVTDAATGSLVYELRPAAASSKKALSKRRSSYKKVRKTSRSKTIPVKAAVPTPAPATEPEVDIELAVRRRIAAEIAEARAKKTSRRRG